MSSWLTFREFLEDGHDMGPCRKNDINGQLANFDDDSEQRGREFKSKDVSLFKPISLQSMRMRKACQTFIEPMCKH